MMTHALIIDPQEDFCNPNTGTLYVPGADADMARLAAMLTRVSIAAKIDALHVTLDSHHTLHIAHPIWWRDAEYNRPSPMEAWWKEDEEFLPKPFTVITAEAVKAGDWQTADPAAAERSLAYVEALERHGRYPLCIWPYHCLIGTPGHAVAPVLADALAEWEKARMAPVDYIYKGANVWTENYSAIQADVPDPDDPATQPNRPLLAALDAADRVVIAGEAGSHCVASTVRDIAAHLGDGFLRKSVLLTDATAPVGGFENLQADFLCDMTARGLQTATTADWE